MAKTRTIAVVEKDLRRVRRAEKRVRRDWNFVNRKLAKDGAIDGLPKDAVEAACGKPPKLSPLVGWLRELSKSLKILIAELKSLEAEKVALTVQVEEKDSDYSL
jgi:hypothetical protein